MTSLITSVENKKCKFCNSDQHTDLQCLIKCNHRLCKNSEIHSKYDCQNRSPCILCGNKSHTTFYCNQRNTIKTR